MGGLEKWEKHLQSVASDADVTTFLQACGAVDKTKKVPNVEHGTKVTVTKMRNQAKFGSCEMLLDRLSVTSPGKDEEKWISLSVESNKLKRVTFDLNENEIN